MTSWRDDASPEAQSELDGLLNIALDHSESLLKKRGVVAPFGVARTPGGDTSLLTAGMDEFTFSAQNAIDLLIEGVHSNLDSYAAVGIVVDVTYEGKDAIRVELEHQEAVALIVLMPYTLKKFNRGLEWSDFKLFPAQPRFWGP